MFDPSEILATLNASEIHNELWKALVQGVKNGMAPFSPGEVAVMTNDDLFTGKRTLTVYVKSLPDHEVTLDVDPEYAYKYPTSDLGAYIGEKVSEHFRSIQRLEPEANIILGDM